jgi:hypothetical protein
MGKMSKDMPLAIHVDTRSLNMTQERGEKGAGDLMSSEFKGRVVGDRVGEVYPGLEKKVAGVVVLDQDLVFAGGVVGENGDLSVAVGDRVVVMGVDVGGDHGMKGIGY